MANGFVETPLEFVGIRPLLCHNEQLADPLNEWAKAMKELSGKRNKTDADHLEMARIEWMGGLYLVPELGIDGPAFPTRAVRKSILEGARLTKDGKKVERGLQFLEMYVPLEYEGTRDVAKLADLPAFRNRSLVKVGTNRVGRTRPMFSSWRIRFTCLMDEEQLNTRDLLRVAEAAGRLIGLGDNRVNGFGRYEVRKVAA